MKAFRALVMGQTDDDLFDLRRQLHSIMIRFRDDERLQPPMRMQPHRNIRDAVYGPQRIRYPIGPDIMSPSLHGTVTPTEQP